MTIVSGGRDTNNSHLDLSELIKVSKNIGKCLKKKKSFYIVVIKSTVIPTTVEEKVIPIIEKYSKKKLGKDFGVCINPEFLTEIHQTWTRNKFFQRDFFTEERIVIGESDKSSGDILEELYRPLNIPIFRTDIKTAEMIKYASNAALSSKVSFWNEIFLICKLLGVDSKKVSDIVSMDNRIGKYGTIHGMAFGGKCLPKDLKALITFAEENLQFKPEILHAINHVNEYMKENYGIRE
jgi:UDPglucose 6-dehydrogenase